MFLILLIFADETANHCTSASPWSSYQTYWHDWLVHRWMGSFWSFFSYVRVILGIVHVFSFLDEFVVLWLGRIVSNKFTLYFLNCLPFRVSSRYDCGLFSWKIILPYTRATAATVSVVGHFGCNVLCHLDVLQD